jgi:hypothetical protein
VGTNLTTFDGALSNQVWYGTGINNVYNLAINNTFASGVVQLAGLNVLVRNNLTLTNGTFNGNTRVITVKNNIDNSAIHTSSGSGRILLNGTVLQTLSGSGAGQYGSVEIDNALSIKAAANATINGTLTFTNGIYDIQQYGLTFGLNAAIGGTPNSTKMLRTSGVILDAGVSKICGTGAFNFTFPFGVGGKYTPLTFNATTNTTIGGTITAKPVNSQHPATSTTALLKYYWQVSNTGFTGGTLNITHDYYFDQIDANGRGIEANYIAARFKSDLTWALAAPLVGSVDITNNVVNVNGAGTGVDYINGDYTAGEPFAFTALPTYISNGTGGGNWEDPATWQNLEVPLPGSAVLVIASDIVTVTTNSRTVLQVTIEPNATIELGTTKFHNFGTMLGTGTLSTNSASLPGGNYTAYVAAGGGTIRFNGTGYTLPGFPFVLYNNLIVNSSGVINMATVPYTTNGNFTLSAGTFNQGTRGITVRGNFTNVGNYNQSTGNLAVSGNFTNSATFNGCGSCAISTGTITLAGNFTNNGAFTSSQGSFTFNGTTNQTLGGVVSPSIFRVTINKTGGKVILAQNATITRLTLTQRNLVLGSFTLTLPTAATALVGSASSYIEADGTGVLRRNYNASMTGSALAYPVGDPSNYTPLTLTINSASYAVGANITVNVKPNVHPQIGAAPAYLNRYWTVSPTGITSPNYTISYTYANPIEITGDDTSPLFSAGKYSGTWLQGGTYTRAARTFNWSALTSFSDFTGCEACGSVVLPVTLVNFRAAADNGKSLLTWTTASETGSSYFDIERSSDGKTFQKIGSVISARNSNVLRDYQFVDANPFAVSYYRLKQVDINGDYDYSSMVKVTFSKNKEQVFNIFPNPANASQEVMADLSSFDDKEIELTVSDILGRQLLQQTINVEQSKPTTLFNAHQLSAGVYIVAFTTTSGVRKQQRLVIQK